MGSEEKRLRKVLKEKEMELYRLDMTYRKMIKKKVFRDSDYKEQYQSVSRVKYGDS